MDIVPDHRRFTFQLRRNLSFSNGRPVVADDFVYGLERILNPATGTFFQSSLLGVRGAKAFIEGKTTHVEGLQAPSPDVLVIELERGEPSFGFGLAQIAYPLPAKRSNQMRRISGNIPWAQVHIGLPDGNGEHGWSWSGVPNIGAPNPPCSTSWTSSSAATPRLT